MTTVLPRPPFDPELEAVLALLADQLPPSITPELIPMMRSGMATPNVDALIGERPLSYRVETIEGHPMIDDRDASVSTQQIDGVGVWDRTSNLTGWNGLLGERREVDDTTALADTAVMQATAKAVT